VSQDRPSKGVGFALLERLTAIVLLLVVASLGWILVAAYQPDWVGAQAEEKQAVVILVLLATALGLVSVVALLHTRDRKSE